MAISFLGDLIGNKTPSFLYDPDDTLVIPKCFVGVELEVEGVNGYLQRDIRKSDYWKIVRDDSLRNNGMEFVFSQPLFGRDILEAIKYATDKINQHGHSPSYRTSMHVHIDIRDIDVDSLKTMIYTYLIVERLLLRWSGGSREENIFCIPYFKAEDNLKSISKLNNETVEHKPHTVLDAFSRFGKYSACNLRTIVDYGSVEFRQMPLTTDYTTIITWINILQSLKSFAVANPDVDLLASFSNDVESFLTQVFGDDLFSQLLRAYDGSREDVKREALAGLRVAQSTMLHNTLEDVNEDVVMDITGLSGEEFKEVNKEHEALLIAIGHKLDARYPGEDGGKVLYRVIGRNKSSKLGQRVERNMDIIGRAEIGHRVRFGPEPDIFNGE